MPKKQPEVELLLKALGDLEDFLPRLVLVGGWVPLLYVRYLWKSKDDPLLTFDIDFGIKRGILNSKETIAERVSNKSWGEHHVRLGHATPFVPIVCLDSGLKAPVEFIAGTALSREEQEKLVGWEIQVNTLEDFDLLLENTISVMVDRFSVPVPSPEIFVFHKLLTFKQRQGEEKKRKDLYYAYHVLLSSPEKEQLAEDVRKLITQHSRGRQVTKNIESFFEDESARGPMAIAQEARATSISMLIDDISTDAYTRIAGLLSK